MKIGIVAFSGMYPFKYGGPQESLYHLLKDISNSTDIKFRLFLRLYENNFKKEAICNLRNVEVIPFIIKPREEIKLLYASSIIAMKSKDLDIIHYNAPPYFLDVPSLRLLGKPITFDFHGGLFAENLFEDRFSLRLVASILKNTFKLTAPLFDKVIAHSHYMKDKAIDYGVPEDRIEIIPIGISLKEFDNAKKIILDGDPTLLFVGRFERIKGCHVLLEALPEVINEYPKLRLYIIGKGPMEEYLRNLASKLKIENNVYFTGNVKREILLSYYKSVDLCVFPSSSIDCTTGQAAAGSSRVDTALPIDDI